MDLDGDGILDHLDPNPHDGPTGDLDRDGIPNSSDFDLTDGPKMVGTLIYHLEL